MENFIITIKAMSTFAMSIIGIILIGVFFALIVSAVGFDSASPYVGGAVIVSGFIAALLNFLRAIPPHQKNPIK